MNCKSMNFSAHKLKPGRSMQQNIPRQSLYHRGHLEGNRYVFSAASDEEHPLQVYKPEPFVEKELQPGDTLQKLSLHFNCSIAELKRINIIHRDNEIFARRTIKIPARLFTTQKLASVHTGSSQKVGGEERDIHNSSESLTDSISNDSTASSRVPETVTSVGSVQDFSNAAKLDYLVGDLSNFNYSNRTELQDDNDEDLNIDSTTSLLLPEKESVEIKRNNFTYSCNGADWGLSWAQLLICSLLLGFVGGTYVICNILNII